MARYSLSMAVREFTPPFLRVGLMLAWLEVLVSPIKEVDDDFENWKKTMKGKTKLLNQKVVAERELNQRWGDGKSSFRLSSPSLGVIKIEYEEGMEEKEEAVISYLKSVCPFGMEIMWVVR